MRARILGSLLAALAFAGCADNDSSLEIVSVCSIPESCSFSSQCDQVLLGDPWVDLQETDQLQLFLEVRSQVADNADPGVGRVNTKDARIKTLEVTYTDGRTSDGAAMTVPGGSIRVEDIVPAGGSSVVLMYGVLPGALGAGARAVLAANYNPMSGPVRVVANIVAKGNYLDGAYFETAPFEIPIEVCNNCTSAGTYCPAGEVPVSVCPQFGQFGTATCQEPATP